MLRDNEKLQINPEAGQGREGRDGEMTVDWVPQTWVTLRKWISMLISVMLLLSSYTLLRALEIS